MLGLMCPRAIVIGRVLNHAERDVTAVYDRHSYDAEKRTALEAWDRKLESIGSGAHIARALAEPHDELVAEQLGGLRGDPEDLHDDDHSDRPGPSTASESTF